jgi:hypothetical protein
MKKIDETKVIKIINEEILQERLTTHSTEIHREISKIPNLKRINFWSTADSMVGLYRYGPDGYAYEIEIRPVEIGKHKDLWGNQIKKREERV